MKTVFLRVLEAEDKASALLEAVRTPEGAEGRVRFDVDPGSFGSVPRSPFAYWVSERMRGLFGELPFFQSGKRAAVSGGKTLDDFRWIRANWEAPPRVPFVFVGFSKGGVFSVFYADVHLMLNWRNSGRELKEYLVTYRSSRGWSPNWTAELHGSDHYLRPGVTWSRRTTSHLSFRAMPANCIFADKGPAAFVLANENQALLALLAVVNSGSFAACVALQLAAADAAARSYEVGIIQSTPVPDLSPSDAATLAALAHRAWSVKRSLDTRTEISHAFILPALLQVSGPDLATRSFQWAARVTAAEAELIAIQAEVDARCFDLYGIEEADRRWITEGLGKSDASAECVEGKSDEGDEDASDEEASEAAADSTILAAELVSWAVGVAFGRFDIRLATGARAIPGEPGPFDPLPACSPGMLTGPDGLPIPVAPADYPLAFPENGVLVDDVGHPQDLGAAVRAVFEAVFGGEADRWWHDVAAALDPRGLDLRTWLATSFFEHHLKRHSKSRRKAPILWQLGTRSGRYSVWLYAHRLTRDSLFLLQNEVVGPKLAHEERKLTDLVLAGGEAPSTQQRHEIDFQKAFVEELRAMQAEVKRVAPLWNPDLDDGVVLTTAPLWRLVPQHKAWQKELESKWKELAARKYDWAHIAMHLWPQDVIPKCATDRSLAIAHGLEDVFWFEGSDGRWLPRTCPTQPVEALVGQRGSPAVQAALDDLLTAPSSQASSSRSRKASRTTGTAADRERP